MEKSLPSIYTAIMKVCSATELCVVSGTGKLMQVRTLTLPSLRILQLIGLQQDTFHVSSGIIIWKKAQTDENLWMNYLKFHINSGQLKASFYSLETIVCTIIWGVSIGFMKTANSNFKLMSFRYGCVWVHKHTFLCLPYHLALMSFRYACVWLCKHTSTSV